MKLLMPFMLVGLLTITIFGGISFAQSPSTDAIGNYVRIGQQSDLTADHVHDDADGFTVAAPALSSTLRVEHSYLSSRIGAWAANEAFVARDGMVEFEADDVRIRPFVASDETVFTFGSPASIEFLERPMWVSVQNGTDSITLDMDDGETAGQSIYVAKAWLWAHGMHRPIATHEDGAILAVQETSDRLGFVIDVPHFSQLILTAADIEVLGRQGGVVTTHSELITWAPVEKRLAIQVSTKLAPYDLLVERDWFSAKMPYPAMEARPFEYEVYNDKEYYTVHLSKAATGTTVYFDAFVPSATPVWTFGDPGTVATHGFNQSVQFMHGVTQVSTPVTSGNLTVNIHSPTFGGDIFVNSSYLQSVGIEHPRVAKVDNSSAEPHWYQTFDARGFVFERPESGFFILPNGTDMLIENRTMFSILTFSNVTNELVVELPAYTGWLNHGLDLWLVGIPWGESPWGGNETIGSISIAYDGVLIGKRNESHASGNILQIQGTSPSSQSTLEIVFHRVQDPAAQVPGSTGISEDIITDFLTQIASDSGIVPEYEDYMTRTACNIQIDKWKSRDTPGQGSISKSEVDRQGYATRFDRSYHNDCDSHPATVYSTHFGFGWATRAKTWVVGTGTWGTPTAIHVENSESTGAGGHSRYHFVKGPRVAMTKMIDIPNIVSTHSSVAYGNRNYAENIDCYLDETDQQLIEVVDYMALASIAAGLAWNEIRPEQYCVESLTKYDPTLFGVSAGGGRMRQATADGHEDLVVEGDAYVRFDSSWRFENPPPNDISEGSAKTHTQGRVTISEHYYRCADGVTNCAKHTRAFDYWSAWKNTSLAFSME